MKVLVTLQTIADELGVSKQTVSNAFGRPDQLSPALRSKILGVADRLGYSGPDPRARALSSGATGVIGVVLTERSADALTDPAAAEFLAGVAEALDASGRNMLLVSGRPDSSPGFSPVGDAAVDGLIVYSLSPNDAHLAAAQRRNLPLVIVDQPRLDDHPYIGIDQHEAGALAAAHLNEMGHSDVAVLALRFARDGRFGLVTAERLENAEFPLTSQRLVGITDTADNVVAVWECPDRDAVGDAVEHITQHTNATAIIAMSDAFALDAIDSLRQRNIGVPGDISVIGIDDTPLAQLAGLSTVHQDHRAKGHLAVAAILGDAPRPQIRASLVARSTTAKR